MVLMKIQKKKPEFWVLAVLILSITKFRTKSYSLLIQNSITPYTQRYPQIVDNISSF